MLVARVLRSPHAHARIVSIDTSKAEALPGVQRRDHAQGRAEGHDLGQPALMC